VAAIAASASAQVPPAPPLPGQESLAANLVTVLESKDVKGYSALLADNLTVTEDGKLVASNKQQWLSRFAPKLAARGVSFKLGPGYQSTGRLLFIEYFSSTGSWNRTPPPDCCWSYDAVAYDVRDGRVIRIQKLNGGPMKLDLAEQAAAPE
jgi:hypothetical protein